MSKGNTPSPFDYLLDFPSQFEMSDSSQNSTGEENQRPIRFPGTQSPLFTYAGGWVDTQYQEDPQALPSADPEIPTSQHAQRPEPWTPYAVGGTSPSAPTYPSPTMDLPYGHAEFRTHSFPMGDPCYSPSTMWSAPSDLSSGPVRDRKISADFASTNTIGVAPTLTYAQVVAQTACPQASGPIVDPNFLDPNWPHQPRNNIFINHTITDIQPSQTPSIGSRTSGGPTSRRRRPPRPTPEPREGPYLCKTCGKKFDTPGYRNHHEIIHGEPSFSCPVCSMGFLWHKDLSRHMTKHTKVKDYKCGACGRGFTRRDNCRRHEDTYHSQSSKSSQLGV